ncbi:MAG: general secretion pathway protein GspK [Deltaproteobacteria bacterium]|nr:general secretion pathway protein GspK [Deltaproteobacteria bacterium]
MTRKPRPKRNRQRGIALAAVLVAVAVILVMTNQFGTTTNVDLFAAANHRDQMRSHFLARSAVNLSELVIRLQQRIDNIKQLRGQVQITDFADQVILAFCGGAEEVKSAVGFSPDKVKGLGANVGTCGIVNQQITTEDDKLNVNCLNGNDATAATFKSALDALLYFPAYDPVFEEADAEDYRRDRVQQVAALADYIDANTLRNRDRGTTEDYGYESLKDPYRMKNNYIDTVGELKLVRGVDDRFWTLFGSAFTVYGSCKINLSALSNTQLIAAVLFLAAKNPNDPVILDPKKLFTLASLVAKAKQFGQQFLTVDDFITYVKDPAAALGAVAGADGGAGLAGSSATAGLNAGIPGLTGPDKLKLELDKQKLSQLTTAGPRRTYRVQAWGEIDRKQKDKDGNPVFPAIRTTLTGVWDTKVVPQNARKTPAPKGAWVYLRED